MKQLILAMMAALFFTATSCTGSKESAMHRQNDDKENKVLVAYFSATGTTERIAKKIAEATGADLVEIQPEQPYTAEDLNWRDKQSRSTIEMNDSTSRPGIRNPKIDDNDYDMIFLGYPIWWEVAPTIINTFIESNDFQGATVIPFATSGGSTIENSTHALMQKYPEIKWKEGKLLNNVSDDDLAEWIKSIL